MACPVCGAENESGATFCFRCGARLLPAAPATGPTVSLRPGDTPPFGLPVAERDALEGDSGKAARVYEAPAELAPVAPPAAQRVYAVPGPAAPAGVSPPTSNSATVSLVLGLVGQLLFWVLACVTLGTLTPVAAAAAIPAVIVGRNALREIRVSNGRIGGEGVARAGVVLGWVTIGFSAVALVIIVAVIVFLAAV